MDPITYPLHLDAANWISPQAGQYSAAPTLFAVHASNNPHGAPVATVQFQDGAIGGEHIDGIQNEDALLMVRARLMSYQSGPHRCRENALAVTKIEEALDVLCRRTQDRRARQVEGTDKL